MERRIQFIDAKKEYEPCSDCSTGDQTLSGESTEESGLDRDKILSGEPRNLKATV